MDTLFTEHNIKQGGCAAYHKKRKKNIGRRAEILHTQAQQARSTDYNNAVTKYLIFDTVFTPWKISNR